MRKVLGNVFRWLLVGVASLFGLALLVFFVFYIVDELTPLEAKVARERQQFLEYQKTPDKFQYIGQTGLILRIPAGYFLYDYANINPDGCFNDKACAESKRVKRTYFSFAWPSGTEQDYETAFNPLHTDRIRAAITADYDEGNCRPGGWVRSCQGDRARVLEKWLHFRYIKTDKAPERMYGLTCHNADRGDTIREWLCFGERGGTDVILTVTLAHDSGWNPGTSISYVYKKSREPVYVSIHASSKHAADWPRIIDRSRVLIAEWTVPD